MLLNIEFLRFFKSIRINFEFRDFDFQIKLYIVSFFITTLVLLALLHSSLSYLAREYLLASIGQFSW